MKSCPQTPQTGRALSLIAGAWTLGPALALASTGLDVTLGNALNPHGIDTVPARDPEGVDAVAHQRSPSGLLYEWPKLLPSWRNLGGGWEGRGHVEAGGLAVFGDEDSAWFREYKDLETGLYLNNFFVEAVQPERARFFRSYGGALGYRDQFFDVETGRYNDWKVRLFYNEIPHVYTTTYRSLWTGVGSGHLLLKGLTPGGTVDAATTQQNIVTALDGLAERELSVVRRKGGIAVEKYLTSRWRLYGDYQQESREGERPFGAVFGGGGGGGNVEIPESIDYTTHDVLGGLRYDDRLNNLNVEVHVSMFRNNIDTLTFENPLYITVNNAVGGPAALPPTLFTTGRFDLYPDNDYYNIRGEYGRSFPDFYNGRLTAVASVSKFKQDDDLISPTEFDLVGGAINDVPTDNNWNSTLALSKDSADAEIDQRLFDVSLLLRPTSKLDLKGEIRWFETDNKTDYLACNPLTGQWGRLLNDGSGATIAGPDVANGNNPDVTLPTAYNSAGCDLASVIALGLVPAAGNINIRNIPFDYRRLNYALSGNYRFGKGQSVDAKLGREEYDRDHRERDKTWENSLKVGYVNRGFSFGTLRVSGEYAARRGDDYDTDVYRDFTSASLGPEPTTGDVRSWIHSVSGLRKYDLADRDLLSLDGRLNVILRDDMDLGLSLAYQDFEYPDSDFGRTDHQTLTTANVELNYQPSSRLGLHAFYSWQQGHLKQAGVQPTAPGLQGCTIGRTYYFFSDGTVGTAPTPPPGATMIGASEVTPDNWKSLCGTSTALSPLFPASQAWDVEHEDRTHAFGLGVFYDFLKARLTLDYTYLNGVTEIDYDYNASALGITDPLQLALIGGGMPDLNTTQHIAEANLIVPINKNLAVRALYRYETGKIDDWHYNGVATNPVPANNAVYLDSGTQDYSTSVVGLLLQMSF